MTNTVETDCTILAVQNSIMLFTVDCRREVQEIIVKRIRIFFFFFIKVLWKAALTLLK